MKLEWSLLAFQDRRHIFDYIEQENPNAANAIDQAISEKIDGLSVFPEQGRLGRVEGTRELVVRNTYIVVYKIYDDTVRILRILHNSQLWPR